MFIKLFFLGGGKERGDTNKLFAEDNHSLNRQKLHDKMLKVMETFVPEEKN